jgi:hypothetical protein
MLAAMPIDQRTAFSAFTLRCPAAGQCPSLGLVAIGSALISVVSHLWRQPL